MIAEVVNSVQCLYFSPTGSTKKIVETVARGTGMPVLAPRQDGTEYFDIHHTANDTLDKVNRDDLDQNVAIYTALTWFAANVEGDFGRLPVEETPESQ